MNTQNRAQVEEQINEYLMAGGTMHELYGITSDELEALYTKGFQEYNAKQYSKAIETFSYLIYLNPYEKRFLFAFGALLQTVKDYKKAIYYYTLAAEQDIADPTITLHIVECLVALGMQEDALAALEILLQETVSEPKWSALYTKARAYQTLLTQKNTNEK